MIPHLWCLYDSKKLLKGLKAPKASNILALGKAQGRGGRFPKRERREIVTIYFKKK